MYFSSNFNIKRHLDIHLNKKLGAEISELKKKLKKENKEKETRDSIIRQ